MSGGAKGQVIAGTAGALARFVAQAPTSNESVWLDAHLCLSRTGGRGRPRSQ
jgi:hypothetical protein